MKKQYLLLILLLGVFFIPKNTFAFSDYIDIKGVNVLSNDHLYNYGSSSMPLTNIYQRNYYTLTFPSDYSVRQIEYIIKFRTIASYEKAYDVSFLLKIPNIGLIDRELSYGGGQPIVLLDGVTCSVNRNFSTTSSGASPSDIWAVKCDNVIFTNNIVVSILTPDVSVDLIGLSKNTWGITERFTVNSRSYNSDITSAIDKNTDEIKKGTEETKKQTETIKDSDTSDASSSANSFFGNFESSDFGLSDVITKPLTFINGLASNQCNSLVLPLPFVNQNLELPCMTSIYSTYFSSFLTIYQTITTGLIAYWVCINIFRMVQNFKNPDNDEIEVMDL